MELAAQFIPLAEVEADWLVVPVWENEPLDPAVADLDVKMGGPLSRMSEKGDITGKAKELTPLHDVQVAAARRVLAVGLGSRARIDFAGLVDAASAASRSLTTKKYRRLAFALPEAVGLGAGEGEAVARAFGVGLRQGCEGPGLRKSKPDRHAPAEAWLVSVNGDRDQIAQGTRRAAIEGRAVSLARELVNLPPCDLYPETFALRAQQVAAHSGLDCVVLDEPALVTEKMNALLAVARGSERPPRLVVLRHLQGNGPLLGLVGKGVTFDSGGLSLKTNDQMVDMKCDMAGAAAVLGAMQAMGELKLPVNVIGVMALVENLPSGKAMKLGDVLHARNGKTIEVLNTDAEGRLILADALSYAVDQKAAHLVDLATLTGACMVALGYDVAGLMTNNDDWGSRVREAGDRVGEKTWPLPMFPAYAEMIKSDVADMKNTGGSRYAGAITAAKLLEEFVGDTPWAHLDIAGPAWAEKPNAVRDSGGTGCFVRTLVELARTYGGQ